MYEAGNDVIALRNAENGFYFSLNDDGELVCESPTINENCLFELFDWGDGAVSFKSKVSGKYVADAGVMKCCSDNVYGWFVKERFMMERDGRDCILRNWQNRFLTVSADRKIRVSNSLRPTKKSVFNIELFSSGLDRVRRVATEAHNVLVICGNNPMINARECHDRKHLDLPQKQLTVMDNVASINANTVLCLVSGYPFAVNDERISAIVHITHAGPAIGTAVAKTIFGDVSPAGRCPITWYRSEKELCDIKDYNIIRTGSTYLYYEGEPLFPFGHGLSYTSFRYGSIKTDKRAYVKGETVKVTFDITNMGGCSSDEVAQLYIAPPKLPVTLPEKQLRAFKRVFVPKGEVITVTLSFKVDDLAFWNDNIGDFDVFAGTYELLVGGSSTDIRRTAEIHISGSEYTGTDVSRIVHAVESTEYLGVTYDADEKLEEYALINDWQSFISYEYCEMKGYHRVDLVVSNPGSSASLSFICEETDEVIAVCEIPPTGSLTEFIKVSAPAEPVQGLHKLKLVSSGMISLKSFSFS